MSQDARPPRGFTGAIISCGISNMAKVGLLELVRGGHRIGEAISPGRAALRLRVDAAHIAAARCVA
jgi:hypothetical protein